MKKAVILGAGTAGTMMANHLAKKLPEMGWELTVVDQEKTHYYQPGFLFVPFGIYEPKDVVKPITDFLPSIANVVNEKIDRVLPDENKVLLQNGEALNYDILVIATGSQIAPDEVEGMLCDQWHKEIFDFYTYEGTCALGEKLKDWKGGKLVVHVTEMPIKCPVAPLEFAFLADAFFVEKGMRDKVDITFVTPLSGAFTKPVASDKLGYLLKEKNITIVPDFAIERVDSENRKIHDYGGKEVEYDLLVTVPTNMGDSMVERSGFGDDLNFIPTDKCTLQSKVADNIFVIGDATNLPASKAGSVAHFEAEILYDNILRFIDGKPLGETFDGHSNCFIETGHGKALLIDFNYTHEPVEGSFPLGTLGPLKLLKESRVNHLGKLAFRWVYWNILLKGRPIPFVPATMSEAGKQLEQINQQTIID
ncbi:MAG: NAD(P)/FAD-dependent oxidoreductase [Flavobacteriales bacterium]|nr:NAD(P)/FAD-dependent oxidoreductase [Flavobacteriales bacterium]MCB9191277.1 NAD(P)/FAD-dependent oxidoreductase [Flavobacteriales bacterium]MCB9204282.1 NAD(P)/FAD-dependent oxidoreductase [Flavobacteriales bacterium]